MEGSTPASAEVDTDLTSGISSLTIGSLSPSDAGIYECKIKYKDQDSHSLETSSDQLTITTQSKFSLCTSYCMTLGLPLSTVPLNTPSLLLSHNSPFFSGSSVSFECKILILNSVIDDPGIKTEISYSKDGNSVMNNSRIVLTKLLEISPDGEYSTQSLTALISPLSRSLDAGVWNCSVNLSSVNRYVQQVSTSAGVTLPSESILCKRHICR